MLCFLSVFSARGMVLACGSVKLNSPTLLAKLSADTLLGKRLDCISYNMQLKDKTV